MWRAGSLGVPLLAVAATPFIWTNDAIARSAVHSPDFVGRDREFAHVRARILEALRARANFAGHYTIVSMGCGTGCSSHVIVDRISGKVSKIPYGGEMQQQLTLRYRENSNILIASWFDDELCVFQQARWNGTQFTIREAPRGQPNAACRT